MPVEFRVYRRLKAVKERKVTLDHPFPRYRLNGQTIDGFPALFKAGYIRGTRKFVKINGPKSRRRLVELTDKGYGAVADYELEHKYDDLELDKPLNLRDKK